MGWYIQPGTRKERPHNFRTQLSEDQSSEMVLRDDNWGSLCTFQTYIPSLMVKLVGLNLKLQANDCLLSDTLANTFLRFTWPLTSGCGAYDTLQNVPSLLIKNEFRAFLQEVFIKRVLEWFHSYWNQSQFCSQGVRWDPVGFWDDSYLVITSLFCCVSKPAKPLFGEI